MAQFHAHTCTHTCKAGLFSFSTLPYSLVREQVRDLLLLKGVVFGEFIATEFSNPLLQEHILSVTVTDISHDIQVL